MSHYPLLVPTLWLAWVFYWAISAWRVKETLRSESSASRLGYTVPLVAGAVLLAVPSLPLGALGDRFVADRFTVATIGLALLVVGLAFSIWARVGLGANWSAQVTIKRGHTFIRSGPYALVRHPIYTGLLVALAGTALLIGEWRAVVGWAFVAVSILFKMRREEEWMAEEFGAAYAAYRSEVAAIIPFVL